MMSPTHVVNTREPFWVGGRLELPEKSNGTTLRGVHVFENPLGNGGLGMFLTPGTPAEGWMVDAELKLFRAQAKVKDPCLTLCLCFQFKFTLRCSALNLKLQR